MANYLRAELYKIIRRKYTYGFFLFLLVGAALLVSLWVYSNTQSNQVDFATAAGLMGALMSMGFYFTIATGDLVFSEQYKFNTLKNEVSYGIPRARLYLGKLAVSCLVALAACAAVVSFYLAICRVFLPHNPAQDGAALEAVGQMLLGMLPLWLGAQALSFSFLSFFKNSTAASFAYIGLILGVPEVLKLLALFVNPWFAGIHRFLLIGSYDAMPLWGDWAVGGAWFLASTALGLLSLRGREIN